MIKHKINFHFSTPDEDLGYLLWQATMQWQRKSNKVLSEVGLTQTQYVILGALAWLAQFSDNVTQKDIADYLRVDRMMTSKILRKLQADGLIERKEHSIDTRAKCVFLTDQGVETIQKALDIKTQANEVIFGNLTDREGLLQQLKQFTK